MFEVFCSFCNVTSFRVHASHSGYYYYYYVTDRCAELRPLWLNRNYSLNGLLRF